MKKICALCLSLLVTLSCFVLPASAEGFTYEFQSGKPNSKSILMMNVDTGSVVYSYNADERLAMASLTKVMTYIVAYENIPNIDSAVIAIPQSVIDELTGTNSSVAELIAGEEYTGLQLLHLMMIPSGNDVALTFQKYVDSLNITKGDLAARKAAKASTTDAAQSGTAENAESGEADDSQTVLSFIDLMNLKAQELGCENTHFTNPHGLYDKDHYTTARDMMKIAQYARTLPHFTEITSMLYYEQPPTNKREESRSIYTTNLMLVPTDEYFYTYATGIKTGSLTESGYCLVSSAVEGGYTYLVVALGSPYEDENKEHIETHGEMIDSRELYRWAFTKLEMKSIISSGQVMASVNMHYAWRKESLQLVAGQDVNVILPEEVESSSLITKLDIPDNIEAPVKKGDVVGTATLSYADQQVATVQLVASETIERSDVVMTLEQGKSVFTSTWFRLLAGGILLLIGIYAVLMIVHNKRRKQNKSIKRYRDM